MESLLLKFNQYLPNYRPCCVHNFLLLTLCLLDGGTVNLYKLRGRVAKFTGKSTQTCSGYKRLIRIFDNHAYSRLWLDLLQCGFRLLRLKSQYLILDGSSWQRHGVKRHYLTLSIEYCSVAVPIYWVDLAKLGISSMQERKQMFRRVFKHFNLQDKILLADREYIGQEWCKYLTDHGLHFVVRLRAKHYQKCIDQAAGKSYQQLIDKAMRSKRAYKVVGKPVQIAGQSYTFVVAKYYNAQGTPCRLLLLSSLTQAPTAIAASYLRRWKIESCFKHLKSNGFDLEQVNLQGRARTKLLMAAMVFAYVLSIHEGLKTYRTVRFIRRKTGRVDKAESVFRHGYDQVVAQLDTLCKLLLYLIQEMEYARKAYRSAKWLLV